jgi:Ca2+-transporting ATPase
MVFVGFAIDSLFYIFAIRDLNKFVYQSHPFSNKKLLLAVGFGWAMLILALYVPFLQTLLRTVALDWRGWLVMISFGFFNLFLIEFIKWLFIHRGKKSLLNLS